MKQGNLQAHKSSSNTRTNSLAQNAKLHQSNNKREDHRNDHRGGVLGQAHDAQGNVHDERIQCPNENGPQSKDAPCQVIVNNELDARTLDKGPGVARCLNVTFAVNSDLCESVDINEVNDAFKHRDEAFKASRNQRKSTVASVSAKSR